MRQNYVIGVLGLPVNSKGEYLLALRNDPTNPQTHNKWEIVGGGLEPNESFTECLTREFLEEIGVEPTILFPYPVVLSKKKTRTKNSTLILACYLVSIVGKIPKPNHKEILDVKWFSPQKLQQLDALELTDEFVAEMQQIRNQYALDGVLQYNHR